MKKVGFIGHNDSIGIWEGSEKWNTQDNINIDYKCGDAILGAGSSFTIASGTYKVKVIAEFKVTDTTDAITIGHGIADEQVSGTFIPKLWSTKRVFDGYFKLEYEGEMKSNQTEMYNVFLYKTDVESANIECTSFSIMFHEI